MGAVGMRAVLLGAPGSGKGTQAAILAAKLGVPAISTGEMLRAAVQIGSALGARVAETLRRGLLVDDGIMAEVVRGRLAERDCLPGFLLDGFPRTPAQADILGDLLQERGWYLDAVLLLDVPEVELVRRMVGRGRLDDSREVVVERLRVYHEQTAPLVDYYRQRGLLKCVDGSLAVGEVAARLVAALAVRG